MNIIIIDDVESVRFSNREAEILELLRQGSSLKSIADRLCLSFHTIHTHTKRIYGKLHVNSRSQAVYKYFNASPQKL